MFDDNAKPQYRGEQGRAYHEQKRGIPSTAFPWVARLRAEKFQQHVRSSDVVLEYGIGTGWNLAALNCGRRLGYDVSEFLEPPLRQAGIEFVPDLLVLKGPVDVVLCHHTLEHVLNPPAVLEEIRRLLGPKGKLLLNVPFEQERRYRRFNPAEPNHHLYSWNVQSLGNLVTQAGFKIADARVAEFGYDRFAAAWATKLRIGETGFRALRKALLLLKPSKEIRLVLSPA